jgi:histidinol-phosphatase
MNADVKSRYVAMQEFTRAAGKVALSYFDTGVDVQRKADASPVTIADQNAESLLREEIGRCFPGDGFVGEEFGTTPGTTGFRWIIDPIDGTRCFIRNIPHWATLVGLEYQGTIVAGTAYEPAVDRLYHAVSGGGAFRNDQPIRVSTTPNLGESLGCYSGYKYFRAGGKEPQFLAMQQAVERTRGYGDYYGFVLVAQGSVDLMVDYGTHIWDVAALKVIVEEAGGRFTNWDGSCDLERPDCLATNGILHPAGLEFLR